MEARINFIRNCSIVLGWIAFAIPFFVLLGWLIDNESMKSLAIGSAPMNPMTALLFILSAGLLLVSSPSSRILSITIVGAVLFLSFYHLIQFKFDLPFRVDHFVFSNVFGITNSINPMAPGAAFGFALLSLYGLLNLSKLNATVQQIIVLSVLIGSVFMVTGYILDVPEFHSSIHLFPASQTCIIFLLLAFSFLLSNPEEGIIKLLTRDLEGARIGRLLIPAVIFIPFVITYSHFLAHRSGLVSIEFGIALVLMSYVIILTTFLFITISSLNARDQTRNDFVNKINTLNAELKEGNDRQLTLNEELVASNEEIQAANEELSTMNDQLALAAETIRAQDQIIIEQKEEALKRSQQHLQIIFSNTKEEILLMDREGRLVLFNNSLEAFILKATGKKPWVGMYVWDMTVSSRRDESKRLFDEALKGNAVTSEAIFSTPEGEVVHSLKYEPVIIEGTVRYITLISVDITDRKIAEAKLKMQFEELEKTNFELDRFAYSVSHDLRAPLSSILGLINVAEMEKSSELPFLGMIKGRVNHLDGFIKDILDYSRNARTELLNEEIDFLQIVEESKTNLKLAEGFDRLAIKLVQNNEAPFYSDVSRMEIIFNNLISNSIKFQDKGKSNPTLSLKITTNQDSVEIIATDNGIGIADEHLNKIFDMFYRATDRAKGSGLGLYIVKETVAKLHGTIKVKSEIGEYTAIEIVIPNSSGEM